MYFLVGQYRLLVKIESQEVNFDEVRFLSLDIYESVPDALPNIKLVLVDDYSLIEEVKLNDGSLIEISLEPQVNESTTVVYTRYRVFGMKVIPLDNGDRVEIVAYLDAPDFFKNCEFQSVTGSSSQVAIELAKRSSLDYEVDDAIDRQTWIRSGITGYQWLSQVANHAWNNNYSAYVHCITRESVLKFYNVGIRRQQESKWEFIYSENSNATLEDNQILITDHQYILNSGVLNRWYGYGRLTNEYSVTTGLFDSNIQISELDKSTDFLNINSQLDSTPRYDASPIDCGNTHDNYSLARIQNGRILSTFSTNVKVISNILKEVQLLDRVKLITIAKGLLEVRKSLNGDFFVDRIRISIDRTSFVVAYNLVREGANNRDSDANLL